jgi:hypothetical protein
MWPLSKQCPNIFGNRNSFFLSLSNSNCCTSAKSYRARVIAHDDKWHLSPPSSVSNKIRNTNGDHVWGQVDNVIDTGALCPVTVQDNVVHRRFSNACQQQPTFHEAYTCPSGAEVRVNDGWDVYRQLPEGCSRRRDITAVRPCHLI